MHSRFPLHRRGQIQYFFYRDEQGKRIEESLRTHELKLAEERYLLRMAEIRGRRSPTDLANRGLTVASNSWLNHRQLRVTKGTLRSEKSIVRSLTRVFGGDTTLRSLADIRRIQSYQDARLKAGISAKSVNNEVQALASILAMAGLWQRIEHQYKPLRVTKSDVPNALTREELTRLVRLAAEADPNAVAPFAAVLAASTGMRDGEIKGVRVGDLHHEGPRPFIYIRRATTKTDSGCRCVVLDRIAVWAVRKLVARARLLGCESAETYLLPTDRARHTRAGDPLHGGTGFDPMNPQSSWQGEWDNFRAAVAITHRRFHDLRHTYISRAAEAGVPIAVVQAQVGHLSAEMTRWYTHISERAQFKAAWQIENQSLELLDCLGITPDGNPISKIPPAEPTWETIGIANE